MRDWHYLLEDRNRFFWWLQTAGWLGFALVHYLGTLIHEVRELYIFIIILNSYAGWLLTIPLRYFYRHIWNYRPLLMVMAVLVTSYFVGVLWAVLKNINHWEIYKYGYRPESLIYYFKYSTEAFYIILCWSGLYFGIKYYLLLQKEREKALKANTMAHQAQLKMLRYQLNPHFLFNTLNAISTLILVKENDVANAMVTKLSDFLRYSLDKDPIKKIALEQEIHALSLYLDIEKVRFEERLSIEIEVDEGAQKGLVPSLILQPLIENSIKHAIAVNENGGHIKVRARVFGNDLLIELTDDGPGADLSDGKLQREGGVGLANTRERLQSLYDSNHAFVISNNHPTGLKISIRLPYEL